MKPATLPALLLAAACLATPACHDRSPVEAKTADVAAAPVLSTGSGGPVFQVNIHDDYAVYDQFSTPDENSISYISITVSRAGPGPGAAAQLIVWGGECIQSGPDWWDYHCTYFTGWGTVPARDVSGSFGSGLSVHTDLRNNPNFYLWGADPGIVSVRWRRTGLHESRTGGSSEYRYGHLLTRQAGTQRSSSATASGEVLGRVLSEDGRGHLATGRGVYMQFERVQVN